jgi:hypothetical protein
MTEGLREILKLRSHDAARPDDVFICCASFEERCLGIMRRFDNYECRHAYIIEYEEPNALRERNLLEMERRLRTLCPAERVRASEGDPLPAVAKLAREIQARRTEAGGIITVDVSTFTKRHLLLLLKSLDGLGMWDSLRLLYTEPKEYVTDLYLQMSTGVRQINPISGFINSESLSKPLLLVILLGYEGDRAMALFNAMDPNETLLVVPDPPYHVEWKGRTEHMNRDLITLIGEERLKRADSRDPIRVAEDFSQLLGPDARYALRDWHCCVAPLANKPQAVGLYLFWRNNPGRFSVVYAQPLKHNEPFYSEGIGRTWQLLGPGGK